MDVSHKEGKSIQQFLDKFIANSFIENDIKLFLIEVREYLKEETFLRELADFVAHGTRDKGLCFTAVNSRHMRIFSYRKRLNELMDSSFIEANKDKPESFFSRKFLDYIDFKKISNKDFKVYIADALEDIEEEFLREQTGFTKKLIKDLISITYNKQKGYYLLKPNLSKKTISILDELLLFIRGAITAQGVFTQEQIISDFLKIASKFGIELSDNLDLKSSLDDLMVCIMAIVHDRRFKLDNLGTAHCYLNVENSNLDYDNSLNEPKNWTLNVNVDADSIMFPIITSNIKPENYMENFSSIYGSTVTGEAIREVFTIRNDDGKLLLISSI